MIRICFTAIAYIISFLSHSNEVAETSEYKIVNPQPVKMEYVVQLDSLKENSDLELIDLN